ncbi:MAG TPA: metallopeptidase family protein [Candidatus Acidoferrales bacterium]
MKRQRFIQLVEEALDALPEPFRSRVRNLAVVVEDAPPPGDDGAVDDELMGLYDGVPLTERAAWDAVPTDRVFLYQRNIERYAAQRAAQERLPLDDLIREEVRLTVLHELGHYFGLDEDALEDV